MDKDLIYLEELKDFCRKVIEFTAQVNFDQFIRDEKLQLAVVKLIENIGEISKRLSETARARYNKVDWRKAAAMRNKLIHDYMDVDLDIVFDVCLNEVPDLLKNLESD